MAGTRPLWMPKVEAAARCYLNGESSGHDPWHAFRVRDLAVRIADAIGGDTEVVAAAALLHDIGHVAGRAEHARSGAGLAAEILFSSGFPAEKVAAVTTCIEHHEWHPGRAGDPQCASPEYQAFADADRLDALGAIGVARTFAFGGAHQRAIWDPEPVQTAARTYGNSSVQHFYDKLLWLPGDMYTEPGRRLAARRVAIMQEFLRNFFVEWEGTDIGATTAAAERRVSLRSFPQRAIKVRDRIRRIFAAILQPNPVS